MIGGKQKAKYTLQVLAINIRFDPTSFTAAKVQAVSEQGLQGPFALDPDCCQSPMIKVDATLSSGFHALDA
jgi:hypothetical protein